jgi:mannose-6-phosphate isomerase-like protein (cupin superfamily)
MKNVKAVFGFDAEGGEHLVWGDVDVLVKASAAATGGAFSLFEERDPVDTSLHVHEREDELFFVLEGRHIFQVGDETFRVGPGGLVFAPRGIPHAQRRAVPRVGRVLVLAIPGGLEGFFRELADAHRDGTLGPDAYARASARYGISWLDDGSGQRNRRSTYSVPMPTRS